MLKVEWDLVVAAQVQDEGQRVDVERSAGRDGQESHYYEWERPQVARESEYRDADVREDEVFGDEVTQFEEGFGPRTGLVRQVVVGVVGLTYAAEEDCHDA